MNHTPNNGLNQPEGNDYVRVDDFNQNADRIDALFGNPTELTTPTKDNYARAISEAANMGGGHPPYFNEATGTWWEWDQATIQYVDTEKPITAKIRVGSTTTLAPGMDANVVNSGTELDVVLEFEIPRGDKGEAARITGITANTLPPGSAATATMGGNDQGRTFTLGIPQGVQGVQGGVGPVGPQGIEGPVGPTGPKGQDGVSGRIMDGIYNMPGVDGPYRTLPAFADTVEGDQFIVDDPSVESLRDLYIHGAGGTDWTINESWSGVPGPQGEQGPQGTQGPTGATGEKGDKGNDGQDGAPGQSAVTLTLPAIIPAAGSAWDGNTVTITDLTGVAPGIPGEVGYPETSDSAVREARRNAMLELVAVGDGSVTIVADGEIPSVAIPIEIYIFGGAA